MSLTPPSQPRRAGRLTARQTPPPSFARAARLCLEELVRACDGMAASSGNPRWRDVAVLLERAGMRLHHLE